MRLEVSPIWGDLVGASPNPFPLSAVYALKHLCMKRLSYAILLIIFSFIGFHCQKEISYINTSGPGNSNNNPAPLEATLQGNIVDENDQPAADVTIQVGNNTVITNADGYFRIVNASLDKNAALVTAEKAGYFKALRSFNATSGANHVMIKLVKKNVAGNIDATTGGTVTLSNGSKIGLPANGIVTAIGGNPYSGNVKIYASYIDPTADDIAKIVPGSFMADDKDNKRVTLASYGMLAVEIESAAGEKLQIAQGAVATLTSPIPSSLQSSAPSTIALWYVDEQKGIWKEEGTAVKNGNNYSGEVKHFSFWNCDISVPAVTLSAALTTGKGTPIVHGVVRITAKSSDFPSAAFGYTDSLGQVSGLVPASMPLLLEVLDPCNNPVYSKNIGPLSDNTNVGTIMVNDAGSTVLVSIEGQLKNCSGQAVTKGYVIINHDNTPRYISVDNSGKFATSFLRCSGSAAAFEIIGVDDESQQQSAAVNATIVHPVTKIGDIIACGTSSAQFINYTVDAVDYSITSATADSLTAYTAVNPSTPTLLTWINGLKIAANEYVQLVFEHEAATGNYPLISLSVQGFDSIFLVQPSDVILTNNATASGGFYEGTFTAKFKKSSGFATVHNINGSFRVRRF